MLHITKHSDNTKMDGFRSISTSVKLNPYCKYRRLIPNSICSSCYANSYADMRSNLRKALERNTEALTAAVIDKSELPHINDCYFRFESFGDLNNATQVINYFNICQVNKRTTFALWTKNPWLINNAIKAGHAKPGNLIIIYSSPMVNHPVKLDAIKKVFPFIDKTFTVYEKEFATGNGIRINCGSKHCIDCLICYKKRTTDTINELKK